jgi:ubiquinone/menaquinone biosynthesis C-methylase UbiE
MNELEQKARQARFFDENCDHDFEIERPSGAGRLYQWSIQRKFKVALSLLSIPVRNQKLLDLCCGSGMASEIYARQGARVTGLDVSIKAIERSRERARRHNFSAEFLTGDAEHLSFPDGYFDIATVHDGLHHLPDPHKALAEMARVARRAVILIEPARSKLTRLAVRTGHALDYEEAGNYVYRFSAREIKHTLDQLGFTRLRRRQFLLYYRHEPFRWARHVENTPLFHFIPLGFGAVSWFLPFLGNKLCVVAEKVLPDANA